MKKLFCAALAACLAACIFSACSTPDSLQMNLFQGYGRQLKLIHLNASSSEKRERMQSFATALSDAQPLDKDISMFAYYPDYILEITGKSLTQTDTGYTLDESSTTGSITAVIDINGDFVDFYFPGPQPEESTTIYRSAMSSDDFKKLVHYIG